MSYLVLARKWRPQTFEDVIGQQAIVQTLQNALHVNRIAQAFLFSGPRGVGKTSVARILAKALNCETGPTPTPCNKCDACVEITKTIDPDVFEIDGASNTGVDNVRDLQETIRYLPQKHRYKIFIVDEVHMLSTPAFNAFLKTLEEPPRHVVFIFATTEPHKIIKTVIDRCQRYDFKKITASVIFDHLNTITKKESISIGPQALQLIAREADGSLRDGQSMLDQMITYAGTTIEDHHVTECLGIVDYTTLVTLSAAVLNGRLEECLTTLAAVFDHGIDIRHFYHGLVDYFRNLTVAKVSADPQLFPDLQVEEITELVRQASEVSLEMLRTILKTLIDHEGVLFRASLPRVVMEALILRLATLPGGSTLKEVVDKLSLVQKELVGGSSGKPYTVASSPKTVGTVAEQQPTGIGASDGEPGPARSEETAKSTSPSTSKQERVHASSEEAWLGLTTFIRQKKPLLASLLDHGTLLNMDEANVEIGFPVNSIFQESLKENGKIDELSRLCEDYFGNARRIVFSDRASSRSADDGEASGITKAQRTEKIREETKKHPLVREALNVFGGGISEIKILNGK